MISVDPEVNIGIYKCFKYVYYLFWHTVPQIIILCLVGLNTVDFKLFFKLNMIKQLYRSYYKIIFHCFNPACFHNILESDCQGEKKYGWKLMGIHCV